MKTVFISCVLVLITMPLMAQTTDPETQTKEFGAISWHRNLDDGIKLAEESAKPIFLQFQEVPG